MYSLIKAYVLRFLKVPPEPEDPMGDVDSLRVFRASPNFFRYRFYLWLLKTCFFFFIAVVGIGAGLIVMLSGLKHGGFHMGAFVGLFIIGIIVLAVIGGFSYVSYVMLRLDYEMRWYKVTDRSLRIREGVVFVKEMTMMFANIQNISVSQGPVQRLFKIADLRVESAGGSGMATPVNEQQTSMVNMHVAFFRGVDNAQEISALMKSRLKALKDAGLGDYDDPRSELEEEGEGSAQVLDLGVLRGIAAEARKLKIAMRQFT